MKASTALISPRAERSCTCRSYEPTKHHYERTKTCVEPHRTIRPSRIEETIVADASTIRDYSSSAGTPFYAYPPERVISIVKAWTEAPWPMTLQEAFTLRDQCGWVGSPDGDRYFSTPVSDGMADSHILIDTGDQSLTCGVDIMITTRAVLQFREKTSHITHSIYREYLDAFLKMYGDPKEQLEYTGLYVDWILPNGSSVLLSPGNTYISVYVRSPEATLSAIPS